MVKILDDGLLHLAALIKRDLKKEVFIPAGGGRPAVSAPASTRFLGAQIKSGIERSLIRRGLTKS
jgi:glycerate kinase